MRHTRFAKLVVLAAALGLTAPASAETLSEARSLLEDGKIDAAIAAARGGVAAEPDNPDLRLVLARSLALKGRRLENVIEATLTQEAVEAGTVIVKGSPSSLRAVYDPALFEEALVHLDKAIGLAPQRHDLRLEKCFLLTDAGRIERARKALGETIAAFRDDPDLIDELVSFGAERTIRGDAEGGAVLLQLVAAAFPDVARVHADYGFTLARLGRKDPALEAMDRAAGLAKNDLRIQRMRSTAAMLLRDFDRAASAYDAAARLSRQDPDRFGAAVASYGSDPELGRDRLRELATQTPSSDPAIVGMARAVLSAVAGGPDRSPVLELAGQLAGNDQTIILAMPFLHQYLAAKPGEPAASEILADLYRRAGCNALAEEVAASAKPR